MLNNYLQKNLELWAKTNPKQAIFLPYLEESDLCFCETKQGELNLKKKNHKTHYYHSNQNATEEASNWFSKLNLNETDILYIYGVGLGYYYHAAKAWLSQNKKRHLIFIEDDLYVIRKFFETESAYHLLQDNQVHLQFVEKIEADSEIANTLYWDFLNAKITVAALPYYAKEKSEFLEELHHKIVFDSSRNKAALHEYLNYGGIFFRNFYVNMLALDKAYLGNKLFGKFHKVPAIICGAGPSLNKQLDKLREIHDHALIFAGGSSMNALNAADIQPHFGAGIDPNIAQYERLSQNQAFETPFFYRNRLNPAALELVHGPRLFITGSGGYEVAQFFEEKFKLPSEFLDEGHNVVNFCLEIAQRLGCDPIIFVGLDLAYTDMQSYATGVVKNRDVKKKEITKVENFSYQALLKKDIYGNPIYTLWHWIAESQWIRDFSKEHPETTLINATEGGLGIATVANETFADVIKKHLGKSYDLSARIHGEIQNSQLTHITSSKLRKAENELLTSLLNCIEHFNVLISEGKSMITQLKSQKSLTEYTQSGLAALAEIELSEEPAYKYVLEVFNLVYTKILSHEVQLLTKSHKRLSHWQIMVKKLQINEKRLVFLKDVASVNAELIRLALHPQKAP